MAINSKILLLHKKLNSLIDEIVSSCSNAGSSGGGTGDHHRHHAFSSSDYFFVSTNIARRFMDVPESAIVLAYSDQHPTIKQINDSSDNDSNNNDNNDDDDINSNDGDVNVT